MPLPALLSWILINALVYLMVVLGTRWLARGLPAGAAVFTYPLLLVVAESLLGAIAPHGSFGAMGYSLVDVLPLLQVASIGGMAALTFCLALVPMTVAVMLVRAEWKSAAIAGAAPLLLALTFGLARLSQIPDSHAKVALIGIDSVEALAFRGDAQDAAASQAFAAQIALAASARPGFIVLPEKQLGGGRAAHASLAVIENAARAADTTVIAGFDELLEDGSRVNSAHIFEAGRHARYDKRRMIPGLELDTRWPRPSCRHPGRRVCRNGIPRMIATTARRGQVADGPGRDFVRMAAHRACRGPRVENGSHRPAAAAAG